MKKRVLMLTHQCAGKGGSYMRAISLARPLTDIGYDVTLIASREQPGLKPHSHLWKNIRILQMPDIFPWRIRNAGLSPMDLLFRMFHVLTVQYDVIQMLDHRPCVSLPAFLGQKNTPIVSDWADLWGHDGFADHRHEFANLFLKKIDNTLEPYTHRNADAVTAISTDMFNRAEQLGVSPKRIRLVQVGANIDIIQSTEKVTARQRHNIPQDISVLAYCGFSALDLDLLCETLLLLQKKIPDILLIMTGAKMQPFEEFIKKNKLMANVKHFGTLPYEDLGEILSCGDVMLLPYQNTTVNKARFPNRFGDYLAAGRPIATNNIGDHALIVKDEKLGVVTEPTAEAFAEGIIALLSQRGLLLQMGQNARRLAETQYTWKSVAQPMAELYAELLG